MTEKKSARPTAPTAGQAVENGSVCETAQPSTKDNTTFGGSGQRFFVADLLPTGQQNAVPLRYLKELTHLPGRELRRLIQRERRNGALILSDNLRGYFVAADEEEVRQFVKSMRRSAAEVRLTALHVERGVKDHRNS